MKVSYKKYYQFKGMFTVSAKIVMVHPSGRILLDNGDTVIKINTKYYGVEMGY
jgi:hypothetical protein